MRDPKERSADKIEPSADRIQAEIDEVRSALFPHIEAYGNRVRICSALGYRTPDELHQQSSA